MNTDTILVIMYVLFIVICAIIAKIIWLLAMQLEPSFKKWMGIDSIESKERKHED